MTSRFRPVWFVLDPFTGSRTLIGMMVHDGSGVEFVPVPGATRGLGPKQLNVVEVVGRLLSSHNSFDELPIGAGPQIILGESSTIPSTVVAPTHWVAERVLRTSDAA